ncbi:hemerythrin domain-containing protein [Massilia sp. YIM B02443]|uniref:hemerythrin domain-containing protein n=1 Tax=Massilia sp. YIM B02443 TaxID=3050127 RepID=UPI0025B712A0|nr:hemerythrin domain-containing protein [Massilia sp. YIM B02443]MDN4038487.1 hemerythrin domain-containing protein [Massilia sp. YIM B02443]
MLTSTYTLVALSVEQARARVEVQALLERWRPGAWWGEPPAMRQYAQACESLRRVLDACHWRKLDKFVLPALRRCGAVADSLLAELDNLSQRAAEARSAAEAAASEGDPGCLAAIERCCQLLLERLEREEQELMPLARNRISGEAWFAIANQMLAHDAYQNEQRGGAAGPPRAASSQRPCQQLPQQPPQRPPQRPPQFAGKDHSLPMVN